MIYKGINIDSKLGRVIRHMDAVEEYRDELQRLQVVWDNLTLLGQLSGTRADMSTTRQAFHGLTESLLNLLCTETLKKVVQEISSKAQISIDILVRNLFERTADIGFLATDADVRRYVERATALCDAPGDSDAAAKLAALNTEIRKRFVEYVEKYSVYSNLIVLDTQGRVLVAMDESSLPPRMGKALLARSLNTGDAYVESFDQIDPAPGSDKSLIYSYRITDAARHQALGVVCLVFRLQNEAADIFAKLSQSEDVAVITYIDRDGCVLASSDDAQVRIGARVPLAQDDWKVVKYAGREYLSITRAPKDYQGYQGPGWFGHVMVPVEYAFAHTDGGLDVSDDILRAVTDNAALFEEGLRAIPRQAKLIQSGLNRSVWNGNACKGRDGQNTNQSFSKIILSEISNTGAKTKAVIEQSIANLNQTVVSSIVQNSLFQASLAIDIMDRNLYERANDCRWWALTTDFRRILDQAQADAAEAQQLASILKYINGLYTVYSNLMVYDSQGIVIAVSNDTYQDLVGHPLSEEWVQRSLSLASVREYVVSDFAATPLYENRPTYIYAAAIRDPSGNRVVGGIGIVLDAAPQFEAMLFDSLPRNEAGVIPEGCFGAFVDHNGLVIAATSDQLAPGSKALFPAELLNPVNGQGLAKIIQLDGRFYAAGSRMSSGYREYKGPDDAYRNDVTCLVFFPLCEVDSAMTKPFKTLKVPSADIGESAIEIATFHIGGQWYGMRADNVIEAIDSRNIAGSPRSSKGLLGYLMYEGAPIPVIDYTLIATHEPHPAPQDGQIIVSSSSRGNVGILIDGLGEIPEVAENWIQAIPPSLVPETAIAESVIKNPNESANTEILVIVSTERIVARIGSQ